MPPPDPPESRTTRGATRQPEDHPIAETQIHIGKLVQALMTGRESRPQPAQLLLQVLGMEPDGRHALPQAEHVAAVAPDGYLVLGAAETAPALANGFSPMDGAPGVYARATTREFLRAAMG